MDDGSAACTAALFEILPFLKTMAVGAPAYPREVRNGFWDRGCCTQLPEARRR
jgi:hypothetical protein